MRHKKKGKILSRKIGSRKALFKGLALALILHEKITTTEAKAKAVKPIIERLISMGRVDNLDNLRKINAYLQSREAAKKIIEKLGPRYKERAGGYLRIIKIGPRRGDAAPMVVLELV
ncbi:50S ribosomal protein L17 [Candidatus Parcubacteria bacterium 4484_255]|nr:MAG: 50S ribosomal protein L17 [Candidatus Parcubacteria bacterium 4484_255]